MAEKSIVDVDTREGARLFMVASMHDAMCCALLCRVHTTGTGMDHQGLIKAPSSTPPPTPEEASVLHYMAFVLADVVQPCQIRVVTYKCNPLQT